MSKTTAITCAVSALFLAAGCGSSSGGGAGGGGGAAGFAPPPEGQGFQLAFSKSVGAGQEVHICKEFVVGGSGEVDVDRLESSTPNGFHHLILYRNPKATADTISSDVFDCGDIPGPTVYERSNVAASGTFPPGVGVKLQGGEVVRLELHFLNVTSAAEDAEVALNLWKATAPLTAEAGSFFMYDRDIAVPAHGKSSTKMHCSIPQDIKLLTILPHEHIHGVHYSLSISGGDLSAPKQLFETPGYADLEARSYADAPVEVKKGQALEFQCDYQNDTSDDVVQGPSKTHNEMCMVLGDYYPKMGITGEWCTIEDGSGPLHDGDKTCLEAFGAQSTAKGNPDFSQMSVMVDVCAKASEAWNNLGNCGFTNCSDVCPGAQCNACAQKYCDKEFSACAAATCD